MTMSFTLHDDGSTVVEDSQAETDSSSRRHPNKTEKKRKRYEDRVAYMKQQRKRKKAQHKHDNAGPTVSPTGSPADGDRPNDGDDRLTKRDRLQQINAKLRESLVTGQRICVDLSLESHMSAKECSRLAPQLCRLYGSNRAAERPAHVYFTGLDRRGHLYEECVRKNNGFADYIVDMSEKSYLELFDHEDIVYLTPDAQDVLDAVDEDKVYIMGGLVDETINKGLTMSEAQKANLKTVRLPIEKFMKRTEDGKSFSQVLAICQVFDILLTYIRTGDWKRALSASVPKRKGYVLKE